ncbi:MAG: DUF5050 domain-containing protein [Lachnospiraceae bacterium]|nr:DUF5050 domain-containing protein [Lachnospiraceae bacterium]
MSGRRKFVIILVILLLLAGVGVFATIQFIGRSVPDNPSSVRGNTPGNIYNGGYFCEADGKVYFANPADSDTLYSMDVNEANFQKLSAMRVRNILSGGNFLYYVMDEHTRSVSSGLGAAVEEYGIYRLRNDGKYTVCLLRSRVGTMQLGGNYLYYQIGDEATGTLERISTTKKGRTGYGNTPSFFAERINPASYENGMIYYNSMQTAYSLYQLNVEAEPAASRAVFQSNIYQPIVQAPYVYFLNAADGYKVCRYHVTSGTLETLTPYGADCYNVNNTHIYYDTQEAPSPGLYRVRLDGSGHEQLATGAYSALHLTSNFLYYKMYGTENMFYHIPLNGNPTPGAFLPEVTSG